MKFIRIVRKEDMKIVAEKVKVAQTFWQRFKGLMLAPPLLENEGLLIESCNSIHMMFMRFSIDAVFLDASNKVKKIYSGLLPWFGIGISTDSCKVIEIKKNTIINSELKINDILLFEQI